MIYYSALVDLAWQIGASEAAHAKLQHIEIEQVFIGLLKIGDLLDPRYRKANGIEISPDELPAIENELMSINDSFDRMGLNRTLLRRQLRDMLGTGDYEHLEKVVHRSEECKRYFTEAEQIAMISKSGTLKSVHLLKAILEKPSEHIEGLFQYFSAEAQELKEQLVDVKESNTPFLDRYAIDLTDLARRGQLSPVLGRDYEISKIIRTLVRKNKNNPMLVGEPGVGKTALVRGLAIKIACEDTTRELRSNRILELNIGSLLSGTKYRGELEERLNRILQEARKSQDVIIFIDEIHNIVGAGRSEGPMDAAGLIKPALENGDIRFIGATTISDYRKHIEKDTALERRFQQIVVEEPSEAETLHILSELKPQYEAHHGIEILPDAIEAAVKLGARYLADRHFPDKALDIIDEACSLVRLQQTASTLLLKGGEGTAVRVTEDDVARVVAEWTGKPVEAPGKEEKRRLMQLESELKKTLIGQDEAVQKVSSVIKMSRLGIRDRRKPAGVFLFIGPTGVGKTQLARSLAEQLFGSEKDLIRLDMSEYQERHSVAKLTGSPPGYVGYEEEGQLTGKLRKRSYTVVLIDELEKAHPDVLDIFLQLFDEGRITDAKGRTVDGRNAIFIMTSNIGSEFYKKERAGFAARDENDSSEDRRIDVMAALKNWLKIEFINRLDEIIVFNSLTVEQARLIAVKLVSELAERLAERRITVNFANELIPYLTEKGFSSQYGAREMARAIEKHLSRPLADKILTDELGPGSIINVSLEGDQVVFSKE